MLGPEPLSLLVQEAIVMPPAIAAAIIQRKLLTLIIMLNLLSYT
jgi:hypothetical protein